MLLLLLPATLFSQAGIYNDGPYIFFSDKGVRVVGSYRHGAGDSTRTLIDTVYTGIAAMGDIRISDDKGRRVFSLPNRFLQETIGEEGWDAGIRKQCEEVKGDKIFVISDSHGSFKNFISILQAAGVIGKELAWNYGNNRLVIIGDTFDRGNDVLALFWLIYSLERQAAQAGGCVTYLLGNHDNMVLKGDLRYVKKKYRRLQDTLHMPYDRFFSPETYLGRWLRSKNTIRIIGNTLFVHGGISDAFARSGISPDEANAFIQQHLDVPKKEYDEKAAFLLGSDGPLWYRGLVRKDEKYNPVKEEDLDRILKQYHVSRIVVGHTTFEGVQFHHDGKVISVDSENEELDIDHLYQGIEIEGDKIKVVTTTPVKR